MTNQRLNEFLSPQAESDLRAIGSENEKVLPEQEAQLRQSDLYLSLQEDYLTGASTLEEFREAQSTLVAGTIQEITSRLFLADVESGGITLPPPAESAAAASEASAIEIEPSAPQPAKPERRPKRDPSAHWVYEFLCQQYVKGMEPDEMRRRYLRPDRGQAFKRIAPIFLNDVEKNGVDPAARFMAEITLHQPALKSNQELNADTEAQGNERFIEVTQKVWQDFCYSGKWKYNKQSKQYGVGSDTDLDAKLSFFLLKKAGVMDAINAKPLPPGKYKPGATAIDTGGHAGVYMEGSTVMIDNHPRGRDYATSSSKILYRLLTSGAFPATADSNIKRLDKSDEVLRTLVEMSVDDDSGKLLTTRPQFEHSDGTLRGLHRYLSPEALYGYLSQTMPQVRQKQEAQAKGQTVAWRDVYHKSLNQQLPLGDLKRLKLSRWRKKDTGPWQGPAGWQYESIKQAKEWFLVKPAEENSPIKSNQTLINEGRLVLGEIETRVGGKVEKKPMRWMVNIVGLEEKLRAGHDAAKVYGFDGLISYNPESNSFLVNTTRDDVDLSKILHLKQGVSVRGAMWIKPQDGKPLEVKLEDILNAVGAKEYWEKPQGIIKEYKEKGLPIGQEASPELISTTNDQTQAAVEVPSAVEVNPGPVTEAPAASTPAGEAPPEATIDTVLKEQEPDIRKWAEEEVAKPEYQALTTEERASKLEELFTQTMAELRQAVEQDTLSKKSVPEPESEVAVVASSQVEPEPKVELKWADETGIKFSRELTFPEQQAKQEIDDIVRAILAPKAQARFVSETDPGERQKLIDGYVSRGMASQPIKDARMEKYLARNLPVVEQGQEK